jgi:hypothetical protein
MKKGYRTMVDIASIICEESFKEKPGTKEFKKKMWEKVNEQLGRLTENEFVEAFSFYINPDIGSQVITLAFALPANSLEKLKENGLTQLVNGSEKGETFWEAAARFDHYPENFACYEAFKIFFETSDPATKLRVLEFMHSIGQF